MYLLLLNVVALISCSPTIQYTGRNYQATDEIDLYVNAADSKRVYETMGPTVGTGNLIHSDYSEVREELIKMARRKGADAFLLYGMKKRLNGQNTNAVTSVGRSDTDAFGRQTTSVRTATSTSSAITNALPANFIKYKW